MREYRAQRYQDNRDEVQARAARYYIDHRTEVRAQQAQYRNDRRDAINAARSAAGAAGVPV
jgi:hypothetical protein